MEFRVGQLRAKITKWVSWLVSALLSAESSDGAPIMEIPEEYAQTPAAIFTKRVPISANCSLAYLNWQHKGGAFRKFSGGAGVARAVLGIAKINIILGATGESSSTALPSSLI